MTSYEKGYRVGITLLQLEK